ncbi:MAG: hypothetical protein PHE89_02145 [Alphaproteobacteria bacterium]|nr:hypothetical protein [Alphaproteobacteria bacterium]
MIRIYAVLIIVFIVCYKIYKLNKKVLLAKSFIFIQEIKKGTGLEEAIYLANLFDFMKNKEAKSVVHAAEISVQENYDKKENNLIERATSWGFFDTHTKQIFKKKKRVLKALERDFVTQEVTVFSGNATELARETGLKYWDVNAPVLAFLSNEGCLLKLLLERYKELKEPFCLASAMQIAAKLSADKKYLDKEDLEIIQEWDSLIKNKNKLK